MFARIAAFLVVVFGCTVVWGQALADRVPPDALIYVGWRGVDDLGPAYPKSNLKAVLDECDIRQFIDQFLPKVLDRIAQENPHAGEIGRITASIAGPTWRNPTAFFFAGVDVNHNGPPMPHLGFLWKAGADSDGLARQLGQLIAQAQNQVPFPIKVVQAEGLVALMIGYDNPREALGAPGKSLASDSAFKFALSHVMTDAVAAIYVNYEKLLSMLEGVMKSADPNAAEMFGKVRDTLGINGLKRVILTSGFDGKDWGTMAFVEAPQPRTGLLKMMEAEPLNDEILGTIPKTATMAGASRTDLTPLLGTLRETVRVVHPQVADQFDQVLDKITRQSGVDIEKDLIGSLGDQWAYFTDPTIGGSGLASLTVVNRLKDPERFERSLSKIEDFALRQIEQLAGPGAPIRLTFETVSLDGMTVHYLAIPLLAPSWVVHNGNLYVSCFPQIAAASAHRGTGAGSSILQNPAFTALRSRLGHTQASGFTFADLQRTAPPAYGSWLAITRLAGFGDIFGMKSPPILLPELNKLMSHLSPAGSVKWVDAEGAHMRAVEPFPGSTIVASDPAITAVYAYPIAASLTLPALAKAREQAKRVQSINNLKQIGLGCIMYANNHQGQFPADLGELVTDQDVSAAVFLNPRTEHASPPPNLDRKQLAAWVNDKSDYVYAGTGKKSDAGADTIIAHEKPGEVGDAMIGIVYADGHVEMQPLESVRNKLK